MSFREKSAWLMVIALLVAGAYYVNAIVEMSLALSAIAPPLIPLVVIYVVVLILISITGHIIIASFSPKDANGAMDEREQLVVARAGHLSSYVLGFGVLVFLGKFLITGDGNLMFHGIFVTLMAAQVAEYALQIYFLRRSV